MFCINGIYQSQMSLIYLGLFLWLRLFSLYFTPIHSLCCGQTKFLDVLIGCLYRYGAILEKFQKQDHTLMGRIRGYIVDSAPVASPDPHVSGEFSMAVIQANNLLEDQSQLVSGPLSSLNSGPFGTFVGVYDGHGGPETSQFVNDTLFPNLKKFVSEHQEVSASVVKKAFMATEKQFLSLVREQWHIKPQLASVGTCCLVGIICNGLLYVANAGDSRVVLGRADRVVKGVTAIQLSTEHNASIESVRDELRSMHPDDSQIVVLKHKVWRVKGIIQISRSIGDAYLKKAEFNREPLLAKFRLPEPFIKPILSPEPSIFIHKLNSKDQFLIFASDGLWEQLSNQEAVDIVHSYPRNGIARRLVKAALRVAAKKREMRYSDLKKIDRGVRRHFHDDITVIVVFLDPPTAMMKRIPSRSTICSIRAGGGVAAPYPTKS